MPPKKKKPASEDHGEDKENKHTDGQTNPRLAGRTDEAKELRRDPATGERQEQQPTYGAGATMPVLAADKYAEVVLPNLGLFNPDDIKLDATVVAIGKRRTGKTWVFRNLMYLLKDKLQGGIVISQTDELNKFWQQYVPKKYIHPKYQPEILDAVFERQKKILNDPELTKAQKEKYAPFFVLLDDVISDQRLKYDSNLMELFVAGRHYKLFVLITTQYAKAITPTLRGNTDYCFMMKCVQNRQREALYEDFGDFLTKDAFAQILDAYTEENEVLVVDTCPEHTMNPLDMLYWWKACDPGPFKVGTKEYWKKGLQQSDDKDVPGGVHEQSIMNLITPRMLAPFNRAPYKMMLA